MRPKQLFITILSVLLFGALSCDNQTRKILQKGKYKLVWSDEFDVPGLPDSTKWSFDTYGNVNSWGNNELQYYTDKRLLNAEVKDGKLSIIALKEEIGSKSYSSARLMTRDKGDWRYGKIEIKAKLPRGRGLWPAVRLLPSNWEYGGWPNSGEINIMEHVGYKPDTIMASAQTAVYSHINETHKNNSYYLPSCYDQFHTYKLEWDPNELRFYVDNKRYFSFEDHGTGYREWPFDKEFYLIINLAVGGNLGGVMGVDKYAFPAKYEIDYVRVYQKNE